MCRTPTTVPARETRAVATTSVPRRPPPRPAHSRVSSRAPRTAQTYNGTSTLDSRHQVVNGAGPGRAGPTAVRIEVIQKPSANESTTASGRTVDHGTEVRTATASVAVSWPGG